MRKILQRYKTLFTPSAMKLASAAVLGCTMAIAWGMPANAANTQTATAKSYLMPAGDHAAVVMGPMNLKQTTRRLVPIGDAALLRLKALKPAATSKVITLDAAPSGPSSQGLDAACNTNVAGGFAPSDSHGAAGPSRFVVVTNVDIGVYNKVGCGIVSRVALKTFFAAVLQDGASTTLFDPRVLYDRRAGRFFVTVESERTSSTDQYQYFAISKDSTGSTWWVYTPFILSRTSTGALFCKRAAANFWDYPQAGASNTRWFISANDFGSTVTGALLSIDKIPSLSGAGVVGKCFQTLPFNLAVPMVLDTSSVAFFFSPGSGSGSSLARRNVTSAGIATGSSAGDTIATPASVGITAWSAPPNAPQPNGQLLDTLDGRFQSNSIQSRGFVWNIHAVNIAGRSLIRWYRLSCSTIACSVLNSPTFQTSSVDRLFNPSIATGSGLPGAPGHITASRTIPSVAITGNAAALQMYGLNNDSSAPNWTYVVVGTSTSQFTSCGAGCRWGDYSSTTVDPLASGSAWGFNQLISGTSQFNWFVRAGKSTLNLLFSAQK